MKFNHYGVVNMVSRKYPLIAFSFLSFCCLGSETQPAIPFDERYAAICIERACAASESYNKFTYDLSWITEACNPAIGDLERLAILEAELSKRKLLLPAYCERVEITREAQLASIPWEVVKQRRSQDVPPIFDGGDYFRRVKLYRGNRYTGRP
jgi:hypothetical protein